ncbi:N-acetylmuramoyl-L-alanine amidase [Streptomyces sp. 6N223]|uniref:N-acetylmuramoyl-L-alanine amidase n=1 Tax=Streptomyces sp. 6N223 TaxID=3457412 RepID=UPI003FD26958
MTLRPQRFWPSRRALLRGGAALVSSSASLASTAGALLQQGDGEEQDEGGRTLQHTVRAEAPADTDFPGAEWAPADPSNIAPARRPEEYPVEFVIIHVAQGTYLDTIGYFQNPDSDVSAHYVVASDDGRIAQCVRHADIGWHAGNWDYNTRSIGIEHEGWIDQPEWFTDVMYRQSALLTANICAMYGIPKTRDHIIGHVEVPRATHTDPGPLWDWDRYMELVNEA